jgi:hypothetical protein
MVLLAASAVLLGACATASYRMVAPGPAVLADLQVNAGSGWNLAPAQATPNVRKTSQTWTKDGLLLDRLVIVPAVKDGETILISRDKGAALPPFRASMLPNELEELTESTLVKLFGEGNAVVSAENLRPWKFAEHRGVMFDLNAAVTESPDYRGMVGAMIVEQKLYMILFIAATPHYYDKHKAEVEELIKSAAIVVPALATAGN